MAEIRVRYVREKASGFYFQPTKAMRAAGFSPESLGKDRAKAIARAGKMLAEWDVIRTAGDPNAKPAAKPGTFKHLQDQLRQSNEWKNKSDGRRINLETSFRALTEIGLDDEVVKGLTTEDCEVLYQGLEEKKGPHARHDIYKDLRYLINYAIRSRYQGVTFNPTYIVKNAAPGPRTQKWTNDQVQAAIKAGWDEGFKGAAVALAILYDTSMRPVDARKLPREDIDLDGKEPKVMIPAQSKTGNPHWTTLWPETVGWIRKYLGELAATALPGQPILRTRTGLRYTKLQLSRDMRTIMDKAEIPGDVQARDLRRTAQYERAITGSTALEAGAAAGQKVTSSQAILDTYVPPDYELAKRSQKKRGRKLAPKRAKG